MNRYPIKQNTLRTALLAAGLGLFAVGCANYSGDGNNFVVKGKVTDVGRQSIGVDIYDIEETHGDANGWFEDGVDHILHDNCDCHGFWNGRKKYGHVEDFDGNEIELSQVQEGSCVEFTGKIRSDQEGKTYDNRPVYDVAQIVPCG